MRKDPLPTEFVAYIQRLASDPRVQDPRRIFRGLLIRWCLWRDGENSNALPGYSTPPPEDKRTGFPAGWSQQKFAAIAKEAIGTAAIAKARTAVLH